MLVDEDRHVEALEYPASYLARARHLRDLQSRRDQAKGEAAYRLRREWRGAQCRLLRARQQLWRTWAKRLCTLYGRLIIEEMNLSVMVTREATSGEYALRRSAWYRVLVAPSEFRRYLDDAARKTDARIERVDPAYTTVTCHRCGLLTEQTGALELTCPLGHRWDQDENAARNLLASQTSGMLVQV